MTSSTSNAVALVDLCERLDEILVEESPMHPFGCATWEESSRVAIDMAKAELQSQAARIAELEGGLKPFAEFADNVDEQGWTSNIHREGISVWFGPSNFRQARSLLSEDNATFKAPERPTK